jgi:hypothetical protein
MEARKKKTEKEAAETAQLAVQAARIAAEASAFAESGGDANVFLNQHGFVQVADEDGEENGEEEDEEEDEEERETEEEVEADGGEEGQEDAEIGNTKRWHNVRQKQAALACQAAQDHQVEQEDDDAEVVEVRKDRANGARARKTEAFSEAPT